MLVPHDEATAKVTVDGLAICCFNPSNKTWDLGFLHHTHVPRHQLILQVEGDRPRMLDQTTRFIIFDTEDGNFPDEFPDGFFDNGPVDRKSDPTTPEEKENFRWTLDLEDPNDIDLGFLGLRKPFFPVTRTFIQDAVFYTTQRSPDNLILLPVGQDPNSMQDPPVFGKTNDEIAADIFCNPGGRVVIRIDDQEVARLDHRPGNPWKICLTHLCLELPNPMTKYEKGDLQLFFDALAFTKQAQVLWGKPLSGLVHCRPLTETGSRIDPRSGRVDCDTVRLGNLETLNGLF